MTLERDGAATKWGFRLVGGSDFDTPLIVTRVNKSVTHIVLQIQSNEY